jgi:hypothetical protein
MTTTTVAGRCPNSGNGHRNGHSNGGGRGCCNGRGRCNGRRHGNSHGHSNGVGRGCCNGRGRCNGRRQRSRSRQPSRSRSRLLQRSRSRLLQRSRSRQRSWPQQRRRSRLLQRSRSLRWSPSPSPYVSAETWPATGRPTWVCDVAERPPDAPRGSRVAERFRGNAPGRRTAPWHSGEPHSCDVESVREPPQHREQAIEQPACDGEIIDPTPRDRSIDRGEHLVRASARNLERATLVAPTTTTTLVDVEHHTRGSPLQLIRKVTVVLLDRGQDRASTRTSSSDTS